MTKHLYIAGVDRWRDYVKEDIMRHSLQVEAVLTYQMDIARFKVRGDRPMEGEEIIIEDDELGRMFGGIIVKVDLAYTLPDKSVSVWQVECDDYTNKLDQKLVVERYQNVAADVIFRDIAAKYCPEFTVKGVRSGAPVIEDTGNEMAYKYPSECFKWLCDYIGWHWMPDYYKDLHFFSAEELAQPAPMKLTPGGRFRNIKHTIDTQGLRNRVYVRGGTMLSDFFTYEVKADGAARTWILPHKPHEISMRVGGTSVRVGIENVHKEEEFDYMMNFQEKYIRATERVVTIPDGTTISWTYKYDIDVITVVDDLESQQALAAVQGGDGVYEHVINDDSLITIEAAEAAGNADLREHANPKVKGSFETEVNGWTPGQLVEIDLPDRGVQGTYLVQKVTASPATPDKWTYRVEYGGRLLGIADFLKALVSAQQKQKIGDTDIITKVSYGQDKLHLSDALASTSRTTKWICGDPDAVSGLMVAW
ncbi:hypothetical protein JQN58_05290 [Aneurinibacillus sp. BA2021]|nr:hypothetical protein [Aneurinibacillus sp. BA2021]